MPALSLSCRVCATEHPLDAIGSCSRCFGPLDPIYDWDRLRATRQPRLDSRPALPSIWRYEDLLPVAAPEEPRLAPGLTPLVPAPRLAEEIGDRASSGSSSTRPTRRTRSRTASSPSPRGRRRSSVSTTLSCSSTGNLAGAVAARAAAEGLEAAVFVPADLEPEKLAAAAVYGPTIYAVDGTLRPLLAALGRAVVRAAVGVRQRQPPLVLRRGLEDARVRDRGAAGLELTGRRRDPDRFGRPLPQGRPGIRRAPLPRAPRRRRRRVRSAARQRAASRSRRRSARGSR